MKRIGKNGKKRTNKGQRKETSKKSSKIELVVGLVIVLLIHIAALILCRDIPTEAMAGLIINIVIYAASIVAVSVHFRAEKHPVSNPSSEPLRSVYDIPWYSQLPLKYDKHSGNWYPCLCEPDEAIMLYIFPDGSKAWTDGYGNGVIR